MRIDEFPAFSILDYLKTEEDIVGYRAGESGA